MITLQEMAEHRLSNVLKASWTIRPNLEGRIIRKREGRISDEMAE